MEDAPPPTTEAPLATVNPPHHRSGAALYYILSGTGANTIDGKREARGPGSLVYEPFGLVHQWGNAGDASLTFLAFNIIRKVWRGPHTSATADFCRRPRPRSNISR